MAGKAQPRTARELSPIEAAWLGAMIEGEGSFGAYDYGKLTHYPGTYLSLSVANTEVETIATVLRLAGCGGVTVTHRVTRYHQDHHKPNWTWQERRRANVIALLRQIAPFLTGKQERALAFVRKYE